MSLEVTRKPIGRLLEQLSTGSWKIPAFQREFVWKQSQVFELTDSIFRSRPIGLLTIWVQPQGRTHTASAKIRLRTSEFGDYEADPAQISLVLDGRQRLTSLAIVFGGLRETDGKMLFSGRWFLNLDKNPAVDEIVVYKKKREVDTEKLNTLSECVARGLLPLDQHAAFQEFLGGIWDPTRYPEGVLPDREILALRQRRLESYSRVFLEFQIPVAELPSSLTLSEVCEIFDVLNQTGTRVSTFDLLHNIVYADTNGEFELRKKLEQWSGDLPSFGLLCSRERPDYLCQVVTGCYLSESQPRSRRGDETITSVKGGDLLDTPTHFYQKFAERVQMLDGFASSLFSADVLGGRFALSELAYPTSAILYLALSWAREFVLPEASRFAPSRLSRVFRAFYWSNVLSGRYDQGFLTQFAKDRKVLQEILVDGQGLADAQFDLAADKAMGEKMFSAQNPRRSTADVRDLLLDGSVRGALQDGIKLFLNARTTVDITDGRVLDRYSIEQNQRVDLHHIFPQDWCKNNRAHHDVLREASSMNCFANLTPLRAETNREWKSREPMTAFAYFEVDLENEAVKARLRQAFCDEASIAAFRNLDVGAFWQARASLMASEIAALQFVGPLPPEAAAAAEVVQEPEGQAPAD